MNLEYEGLDFLYLMRHALEAPVFKGVEEPELELRWRDPPPYDVPVQVGTFSHDDNRVVLYVWEGRRRMGVLAVLLHELVHLRLGPGVGHRPLFRRTYQEVSLQVYGIRVPWAACRVMMRYVQWGLAEMANRGFYASIADARAGRWSPPVPAWWTGAVS